MRTIYFIIFIIFIQVNQILCTSGFGSVFPIPLAITNNDPNFQRCPEESGAYTYTTNCSLFHMCTFGIHAIYSCIDGFFFNPSSGKCQYFPVEKEMKCVDIVKHMLNTDLLPDAESVKGYDYYHRRKSSVSKCTQAGIYPDILDCSIFHYCHQNKDHEILKCPNELHFDPKIFMCSAPQLVNCQYEPPTEPTVTEDEDDNTSTNESDTICQNYTPGTYLPVQNKFDEYVVCENNGKSTLMKCKPGFNYNALTTKCEMKPCTMDAILCKNNGQCVDDLTKTNGFKCVCSIEYKGEYCEKRIELVDTTATTKKVVSTTKDLLQFADRLYDNKQAVTTNLNVNDVEHLETPISYVDPKIEDRISIIEKFSTTNSPLSRLIHRFHNNYDQQQEVDEIVKIIFTIILICIVITILGSIIFGIFFCMRFFSSSLRVETVGPWKILTEESKV